jgi:hypothetical protein
MELALCYLLVPRILRWLLKLLEKSVHPCHKILSKIKLTIITQCHVSVNVPVTLSYPCNKKVASTGVSMLQMVMFTVLPPSFMSSDAQNSFTLNTLVL